MQSFFSYHYYLTAYKRNDDNDNQPIVPNDEVMEDDHSRLPFPSLIPLMSSKQKLKCRKVLSVIRSHARNRHISPEKYAHRLLMMYYPFRSESELSFSFVS